MQNSDNDLFFVEEKSRFFSPLTGRYREKIRACIRDFYLRLNGHHADQQFQLSRDEIIHIFEFQLASMPDLDDDSDQPEENGRSDREVAQHVLRQLIECGWLEENIDSIEMRKTFRFTSPGRRFAHTFVDFSRERFKARHRSTRNTRSALSAYHSHQDPHDLVEALNFSEGIIDDFNESLEEIHAMQREQSRAVADEIELQGIMEDFFEYLEKRFNPDISRIMGEESVGRYRADIEEIVRKIRNLPNQSLKIMELDLRREFPFMIQLQEQSILMDVLRKIEWRIERACEVKIPELRAAIDTFTRRSHLHLKQLMRIYSSDHQDIGRICRSISERENAHEIYEGIAGGCAFARVRLINPNEIRLRMDVARKPINTHVEERAPLSAAQRRDAAIVAALETALAVEDRQLVASILEKLDGDKDIRTRFIDVTSTEDLFLAMHALSLANNNHDEDIKFSVESTGRRHSNAFFEGNDYKISVKDKP